MNIVNLFVAILLCSRCQSNVWTTEHQVLMWTGVCGRDVGHLQTENIHKNIFIFVAHLEEFFGCLRLFLVFRPLLLTLLSWGFFPFLVLPCSSSSLDNSLHELTASAKSMLQSRPH